MYLVWDEYDLFFCIWKSVVLKLFVEKTVSFPLLCLGTLGKKNHLTIDLWAYIWTLNCIPLIYVIPCASTILFWLPSFHSKFWNWEVWIFQLCFLFKLFDLFWISWVFCILRSALPFLQRTSWDSDRDCTESIL